MATDWIAENIVEIFGAVTGIAYVILEIRRNILLWPLGIITSVVYIYVFGREGFYANMGLQWYYLVISIYGWYKWRAATAGNKEEARRGAEISDHPEARRVSGIAGPGFTLSPENTEARRASGIAGPGDPLSHETSEARRVSGIVEPESTFYHETSEARRASGIAGSESTFYHETSEARRASGIVGPGDPLSHETSEARRASGIVGPGDPKNTHPPENTETIEMTLTDSVTDIRRIERPTAMWCAIVAALLWGVLWFVLDRATDSPVPLWDGLIASLSVVATWMLTRKYIEQWYVWIFANAIAVAVYLGSGLYPTAVLFFVYFVMAIAGVREWNKSMAIR